MSPVYNRRTLRQGLGLDYLRDTLVCQTSGSWGTQAGSANIIDSAQADPTASGEGLYQRHYLRLLGSAGFIQDLRVGSFNTGSGAFVVAQTLATTIFSGMPFEVHAYVSPTEKDRAIDAVIQDVRIQREVPLWSIDNGSTYSMGPEILNVIDVRYFSDPTNSLSRSGEAISWFALKQTSSGQELRIAPALPASYQLILDAILAVSLGASDVATVNLPDDDLVLAGAATRCYWLMEQQSPGKEAGNYKAQRVEMARRYSSLAARFQPVITRRIQLDDPY